MSFLTRTNAEALMPEDFQKEIVQGVVEQSAVMQLGTKGPNMSRQQRRIPVLSVLPTAYFLNPGPSERDDDSDISSKKLTRQAWESLWLRCFNY